MTPRQGAAALLAAENRGTEIIQRSDGAIFIRQAVAEAVIAKLLDDLDGKKHWLPISTAPRDGSTIRVLHQCGEVGVACWTESRCCAGAPNPNGYFGPGWEDPNERLGHFREWEPTHWLPELTP